MMASKSRFVVVVTLIGLFGLILPSAALATPTICDAVAGNLVSNCGFETGDLTNWTPNAAFLSFPGFNHITTNANSGSDALSIGNFDNEPLASLSQTIADVSGQTYTASFYAYDGGFGGDANAFFEAAINGTQEVLLIDTVAAYTPFSFTFVGTGSDTLTFSAQTNPSEWFLDDVTVLGPSATPEPSSFLLFGTGLLSLVRFRRKLFGR
jgi:hypothetical protein